MSYLWRLEGEQKVSMFLGRSAFQYERVCGMLMRSGVVQGTQLPARTLVTPKSEDETSKVIRKLRAESRKLVVAYGDKYPVLDFATSRYAWLNAKVGDAKPRVNAGAFVTLMLDLELAEKVDRTLVMKDEHKDAKITLTMLRNQDTSKAQRRHVLDLKTALNHEDMNLTQVEEIFKKHVNVEYLNMAKWQRLDHKDLERRMSALLKKYIQIPPKRIRRQPIGSRFLGFFKRRIA